MKNRKYSIKDLENLTNIKAHTIRVWEQRYGLLQPKRTSTNIRFYQDEDLKKLLNINLLYASGYKISKIAKLSESEILEESKAALYNNNTGKNSEVDALVLAIIELDSGAIVSSLEANFKKNGMGKMYSMLVVPLLNRVGELWQLNTISVGHEHFFSNLLREFILTKTYTLKQPKKSKGKVLLFLHSHEEHELGLLICNFLFKDANWETCYLGQNVPLEGLGITYDLFNPDLVITNIIKHLNEEEFDTILKSVVSIVSSEKLIIGGNTALLYKGNVTEKIRFLESFQDIKKLLV